MYRNSEPRPVKRWNFLRPCLELFIFLSVGRIAYWLTTLTGTFDEQEFVTIFFLNYLATGWVLWRFAKGFIERFRDALICVLMFNGMFLIIAASAAYDHAIPYSWHLSGEILEMSFISFLTCGGIYDLRHRTPRRLIIKY